jgi:polysaccharide export outer membrane protein
MRLHFLANSAIAFSIATFAVTLHAQAGMPVPQYGSSSSATTSAGGLGAAVKAGSAGGIVVVPEDFARLKIQPGFLLDTQVFDEPDLSGEYRVGADGNITLPFAGTVHVAGDTLSEAQQKIQDVFKSAQILKYPQVTLDIAQYAATMVSVLGQVNAPGRLQMLAPHTLLDVLSFAGGETQLAGDVVELRHDVDGKAETATYPYGRDSNGDSIADVMVHDGDTVIVPRAGIVYVLGQVTRPGGYLMQEDGKLDTAQAISLALGTTLIASTKHVLIIRHKPDGTYVQFEVSYNKILHGQATPPQLQPQDIIYVPNSRIKTAFTDVQSILTAATTATVYKTVQ